jgi:hypothetical protein
MIAHSKCIFFLSFLSLFFSCSKNPFEQVVTVNLPAQEPSLVPALSLNNYYSPLLNLTATQAPLTSQATGNPQISNATIEILEGGLSKGFMKLVSNGAGSNVYAMVTPFVPKPGFSYSLKIAKSGFNSVTAADNMPSYVAIQATNTGNFKYVQSRWDPNTVDTFREVKIVFTDPMPNGDKYRLIISDEILDSTGNFATNFGGGDQSIISNDIMFSAYVDPFGGGPLGSIGGSTDHYIRLPDYYFDDEFFNGQTKEAIIFIRKGIDFGGGSANGGFLAPYFYLQHHSEASYKFNTTVIKYNANEGNPFSQPVILFSNVVGGFGILGSNTVSIDSLKF